MKMSRSNMEESRAKIENEQLGLENKSMRFEEDEQILKRYADTKNEGKAEMIFFKNDEKELYE